MKNESIPVLIVGGSLVGLSAALFFAWQGVPVIVVERRDAPSPHPRAIGYTPRTMELLHAVGLADQIPEAPENFRLIRARVQSLAGEWYEESAWTPPIDGAQAAIEYSPSRGASIAQDRMEPILRQRAVAFGADVRAGTELLGFQQDADGISARVRRRSGGDAGDGDDTYTIRAEYLIAADGARSAIRQSLGIERQGRGPMRTVRSVLFRAALERFLDKGVSQFEIDQPGFKAFLTTYQDGRWVLMFTDDQERDQDELLGAIHRATGLPDLAVEIIATGRWDLGASVADRFTQGRVFLAGDSAHALPPTRGGWGANTGIADAHNLAWKLAAVLAGQAAPALLDSYDAERRPVAWRRHQQLFARPDYAHEAKGMVAAEPIIDDAAMEFGQLYRSDAVLGAADDLPFAVRPDQWHGQPGTRAPHLWVVREGQRISTLELFQPGWLVLAQDAAWAVAARGVATRTGIPLSCLRIGVDIEAADGDDLPNAFGIGRYGASLIRPDGFVAWRTAEFITDPAAALTDALVRILRPHGRHEAAARAA